MTTKKNANWLPVVLIAGALLAWMILLAAGAYWAPVGARGGGDFRKLWVVAATTGGFLLLWGGVLALRQSQVRRQEEEKSAERTAPAGPTDEPTDEA